MNFLICNATIITVQNRRIVRNGAIAIENGTISEIGDTDLLRRKYGRSYERIDAKEKVVLPGFINTHQHAAMSLLRGYADDLPLQEWLEKWIWPVEKLMTPYDIYVGALLTAAESILSGVTTVNTMYHYAPEQNEAKAFADAGLRGVIGHVCFSWRKKNDRKALEDLARNWHNKHEGLTRTSVDPHSPYTVDPHYMKELKEIRDTLQDKYGQDEAPITTHIHVAETNDEPQKIQKAFGTKVENGIMEYLDPSGILDNHVTAAHCVALTERDLRVMRQRNVKVSHNPISNLKLASGIAPVPRMLEKGITVSLGTDSPCSNNTADMFDVMKTTALLHKGTSKDPTVMPAEQVLEMATIEGAKALLWEKEVGSIETGKRADLIIIGFNSPHLTPVYNEVSHLVYAAKAHDVKTVIINGKLIMENRKLTSLKLEAVMETAEKAKSSLISRLDISVK